MEYIEKLTNMEILNYSVLENRVLDYLIFLAIFAFLFLIIKIIKGVLIRRLKEARPEKDSFIGVLIDFILSIRSSFYLYLAFYISINYLTLPLSLINFFSGVLLVWVVFRLMAGVQMFIDFTLNKKILKDTDPGTEVAAKNIGLIFKGILWVFAVLLILSNLGIEITSLMAGLGIGGIAVAFAFQKILEDLFSSFAIYFDKPFTVGDFIIVGNEVGTVERIGIKTTRIRALQGEEIVMSNRELTNERIHNFKKLQRRRATFNFGVIYGTSDEKMRMIPDIVKKIVDSKNLAEFDRTHFTEFGDSSLNFEVVYYVSSADFADFRNTHQEILFDIKSEFTKKDIEMAFPTRTVHLFKG